MGILKADWRERIAENERERRIFAAFAGVFVVLGFALGFLVAWSVKNEQANHGNGGSNDSKEVRR